MRLDRPGLIGRDRGIKLRLGLAGRRRGVMSSLSLTRVESEPLRVLNIVSITDSGEVVWVSVIGAMEDKIGKMGDPVHYYMCMATCRSSQWLGFRRSCKFSTRMIPTQLTPSTHALWLSVTAAWGVLIHFVFKFRLKRPSNICAAVQYSRLCTAFQSLSRSVVELQMTTTVSNTSGAS